MKKPKVEIEFKHSCSMNYETGLNPGGRKWMWRFHHTNTAEMMGQDYYITALFLICIAFGIQIGLFYLLGWWWLWIQLLLGSIGAYLIFIQNIKYKARINRFAIRMNKKYGVPMDQAIQYWHENEKYLS